MSVARRLPSAPVQISPGIAHPPSRLCPSDIRHGVPYKFRASQILACSPRRAASYPLPVRQASALPSASSRFPVAQNTLAVRLTLPLVGQVEDFHLQVSAPCRAHQKIANADRIGYQGRLPVQANPRCDSFRYLHRLPGRLSPIAAAGHARRTIHYHAHPGTWAPVSRRISHLSEHA
jgi:hypothetical protein